MAHLRPRDVVHGCFFGGNCLTMSRLLGPWGPRRRRLFPAGHARRLGLQRVGRRETRIGTPARKSPPGGMQFMPGGRLRKRLRTNPRLAPTIVKDIAGWADP